MDLRAHVKCFFCPEESQDAESIGGGLCLVSALLKYSFLPSTFWKTEHLEAGRGHHEISLTRALAPLPFLFLYFYASVSIFDFNCFFVSHIELPLDEKAAYKIS